MKQQTEKKKIIYAVLMLGVFLSVLGWFGVLTMGKHESVFWKLGVVFYLFGIFSCVTLLLFETKISRAWRFHLAAFFSGIQFSIGTILTGFHLFSWTENIWIWGVFPPLIICIAFYQEVNDVRRQLIKSMDNNSKMNDVKKGYWDLTNMQIYTKTNITMLKVASVFSPLITAIVFSTAKNLQGPTQDFIGGILIYTLGSLIFLGFALHFAIYVQLLAWERVYEIEILL